MVGCAASGTGQEELAGSGSSMRVRSLTPPTGKPAPRTTQSSAQGRRRAHGPRQQRGLAQVCLLPLGREKRPL